MTRLGRLDRLVILVVPKWNSRMLDFALSVGFEMRFEVDPKNWTGG